MYRFNSPNGRSFFFIFLIRPFVAPRINRETKLMKAQAKHEDRISRAVREQSCALESRDIRCRARPLTMALVAKTLDRDTLSCCRHPMVAGGHPLLRNHGSYATVGVRPTPRARNEGRRCSLFFLAFLPRSRPRQSAISPPFLGLTGLRTIRLIASAVDVGFGW